MPQAIASRDVSIFTIIYKKPLTLNGQASHNHTKHKKSDTINPINMISTFTKQQMLNTVTFSITSLTHLNITTRKLRNEMADVNPIIGSIVNLA